MCFSSVTLSLLAVCIGTRRRERLLEELLLGVARENLKLRFENGDEIPLSLSDADDGSVELRAGGQSWEP